MNWIEKFYKLPEFLFPILVFAVLIFFGLKNFGDYGISWDEPAQRLIGNVSYDYVFKGDQKLKTFRDADYGVGIELPLIIIEKALKLESTRHIYLMRHLVAHFFFLFCLLFCYLLIYNLFKNKWLALAGVLFFVLNPILYAHSFFNTKDIPFMAMYLVCFYFAYKAFSSYRLSMFLLAGITTGFLVNLRVMGILLVLFIIGFIAVDTIIRWKERDFRLKGLKSFLIFSVAFIFTLYISWPYLYEQPFENLANAFKNMSKFRWKEEVLYFGELIKATNLPWHYGFVWMAITTPLIYLFLGISGLIIALSMLLSNPMAIFRNGINRHLLLYILCFAAPFIAVIVFKSVLYDGWRHLYFVYPPFVLLAVYTLHKISKSKFVWVGAGVTSLSFVAAFLFMVQNHPHQQIYFNAILDHSKPEHIRHQFELDYWGVSYLQGIEAVLEMDKSVNIEIQMANASGENNLLALPETDRNRIKLTEVDPKYFITEYRYHPEDYPYSKNQEVFSIRVENNTILSVFKLRD